MNTKAMHDKYGEVVRVSPDTLSFTTAQAWQGKSKPHVRPLGNLQSWLVGGGGGKSSVGNLLKSQFKQISMGTKPTDLKSLNRLDLAMPWGRKATI